MVVPPVVPIIPTTPVIGVAAKRSGTAKVGRTIKLKLTAKADGATISGVKYSYSWRANGKKIGSKSSLKLKKKWKGKKITVVVTATKDGYKTGSDKVTITSKLKK